MSISTNSIIHYTNSFGSIKSVLKEGFRIKYCAEGLELEPKGAYAAHPMISFCDIPLSDSNQHFKTYGYYGIGLSKQWAVENGINPVIYIDKGSVFANSISQLLDDQRKKDSNLTVEQGDDIVRIKSFAKNYCGPLTRNSKTIPDYKFYDEREWRLVPTRDQLNNKSFSISFNGYMKDKDKFNDTISNLRFPFSAEDISYIIVRKTEQIPKMIEFVRSIYLKKYTAHQLDIIFSKICSTEQIIEDY